MCSDASAWFRAGKALLRIPPRRPGRVEIASCALAAALMIGAAATHAQAPPKPATPGSSVRPLSPANPEQGPAWSTLKPAQRDALKPLEHDWPSIDIARKRKWIEIADRYPSMPAQDQARLQTRMAEWTRMTPQERSELRMNYQEARRISTQDRQASWDAYQSLSAEQRGELAARAATAAASGGRRGQPSANAASAPPADARARVKPQPKSNTVPDPALAARPKPVAPSVVQVQPGATTTLISKQPAPPVHQQTGMPKIAATPEFVDNKTLLPKKGAQSDKTGSVAASTPSSRP